MEGSLPWSAVIMSWNLVCLCWGFTAQSTQWGHVEYGQFTNQTFFWAESFKRLTSIVHILLPETDNCPSWISGRERMTTENISWSNLHERILPTQRGLNPLPPDHQSDVHLTEPLRLAEVKADFTSASLSGSVRGLGVRSPLGQIPVTSWSAVGIDCVRV